LKIWIYHFYYTPSFNACVVKNSKLIKWSKTWGKINVQDDVLNQLKQRKINLIIAYYRMWKSESHALCLYVMDDSLIRTWKLQCDEWRSKKTTEYSFSHHSLSAFSLLRNLIVHFSSYQVPHTSQVKCW
jgi:hypothetical protein